MLLHDPAGSGGLTGASGGTLPPARGSSEAEVALPYSIGVGVLFRLEAGDAPKVLLYRVRVDALLASLPALSRQGRVCFLGVGRVPPLTALWPGQAGQGLILG